MKTLYFMSFYLLLGSCSSDDCSGSKKVNLVGGSSKLSPGKSILNFAFTEPNTEIVTMPSEEEWNKFAAQFDADFLKAQNCREISEEILQSTLPSDFFEMPKTYKNINYHISGSSQLKETRLVKTSEVNSFLSGSIQPSVMNTNEVEFYNLKIECFDYLKNASCNFQTINKRIERQMLLKDSVCLLGQAWSNYPTAVVAGVVFFSKHESGNIAGDINACKK